MVVWRTCRVLLGVCTTAACAALAAPQASLVSRSWEVQFDFLDPQRIIVDGTTYWYMLYRVTNNSGKDVDFFPSFRIVTDTLEAVEGDTGVDPRVYDAIAARHKREYPFFAPPAKVTGKLLQGEDNARASAAVFRTFDPKAATFSVLVGGLSGDFARQTNPAYDPTKAESDANPKAFIMRRTLMIHYDLPGDELSRATATPVRRARELTMR